MSAMRHIRTEIFQMTQGEFARLLGEDQATVSRWESGKSRVTLDDLARIRKIALRRKLAWSDSLVFAPPKPGKRSKVLSTAC